MTAMERTPARSRSCPARKNCSASSPTHSPPGGSSCIRASARSPTKPSYAGPAQVTGGRGPARPSPPCTAPPTWRPHTGGAPANWAGHCAKLAAPPILLTTFTRNLADTLDSQLALLIDDERCCSRVEVLNVDRLAHRIVARDRGTPGIADDRALRRWWAEAAADAGLAFTPVFLQHEWEQVILAQDLYTEHAYLTCRRTGRGRPLSKAQRSQIWHAVQRVTAELAAARQSTHTQLANEAAGLMRQARSARYQT